MPTIRSALLALVAFLGISTQANASIVFDGGANPNGFTGGFSGTFSSTATPPVYDKFSLTSLSQVTAQFLIFDTATRVVSGTFALFSCATNCTGSSVPTAAGSAIFSTPITGAFPLQAAGFILPALGAGNYFVEFSASSPVAGDTFSGTVNAVVASVPEPATWTMMFLGFAGVGLLAYRRKGKPGIRIV